MAIGTVVMRNKQYLAAIRPLDGALAMSTMRFADEVVPRKKIDGIPSARSKPAPKELKLASQIIDSLASDWDPKRYHDTYTEELRDLIERKAKGEKITVDDDRGGADRQGRRPHGGAPGQPRSGRAPAPARRGEGGGQEGERGVEAQDGTKRPRRRDPAASRRSVDGRCRWPDERRARPSTPRLLRQALHDAAGRVRGRPHRRS